MRKLILLGVIAALAACTQADQDQYKCPGNQPVYGETNSVCYDATNDYLSMWVNDVEVAYLDSSGNFVPDGTITSAGAFAASSTSTFTGDATFNGGAGAVTFGAASSSIVVPDDSGTGLLLGSTGQLGLLTVDTTDSAEEVNVVGTTATSAFRVDTGFATLDEQAVLTAGADVNGDLLCGGAAGAVTFDAASSSILLSGSADNAAAGLDIGSTGATSTIRIVTTDTAEGVTITPGATGTFTVLGSGADMGWKSASAANTACTTTCAGTGSCVIGFDSGGSTFVDCATATADTCLCAGPAS